MTFETGKLYKAVDQEQGKAVVLLRVLAQNNYIMVIEMVASTPNGIEYVDIEFVKKLDHTFLKVDWEPALEQEFEFWKNQATKYYRNSLGEEGYASFAREPSPEPS